MEAFVDVWENNCKDLNKTGSFKNHQIYKIKQIISCMIFLQMNIVPSAVQIMC